MPRWRQDSKTGKMIPIDGAALEKDIQAGIIVRGQFDSFKSPIDGSVISNQRQYDDHCRKHNVVPAQEFSPEYYQRKADERAAFYRQEHSREVKLKRKQEIHEAFVRAERNGR